MRIAVVGSRTINNRDKVNEILFPFFCYQDNSLITGGAIGVDSIAIEIARVHNINYEIIRPINPKDKLSYLFRNIEIITKADEIVAIWDGHSKGTKFVIDYAKARNKKVIVFIIK